MVSEILSNKKEIDFQSKQLSATKEKKIKIKYGRWVAKVTRVLHEYFTMYGCLPGKAELCKTKEGYYFYLFCERHFGSYEGACRAAGYTIGEIEAMKQKASVAAFNKHLDRVKKTLDVYYKKLGYLPSKTELLQLKAGSFYLHCYRQFGGYENACRAAGYDVETCMARHIRKKERKALIEQKKSIRLQIGEGLKELYGRLGRIITEADLPAEGLLSKENICSHYSTLVNALGRNGLPQKLDLGYNDEEIINEMWRVFSVYGKIGVKEMIKYGKPGIHAVLRAFGTFRNGLKMAGLEDKGSGGRKCSDEELFDELRRLYNEHGYVNGPLVTRFSNYSLKRFIYHFGSVREGMEKIGLPYSRVRVSGRYILDGDLLGELRRLNTIHGKVNVAIVNKESNYSYATYYERFGSIRNALTQAGLNSEQKAA